MKIDISEIQQLAPMPESVARLSKMAFAQDTDVADVVEVIEFDQMLTLDVIKWANSAWSASQTPISTVKDAVVRFGMGTILKLAIGKRISGSMKKPLAGYELTENELWRHSITAALAAESLASYANKPVPSSAFTGALIHDIGKLLLAKRLTPEKIAELRQMIEAEQVPYIDAERILMQTDHAAVGGEIARFWKFPEDLVYAVEHHHDFDYPPDPLLDAVQIANAITKLLGIGLGSEQMSINIHPNVPQRMGLDDMKVEMLCVEVSEKMIETELKWEV